MAFKSFTQAEKDWFIKKTGTNAPINELKLRYYKSQGASGSYLGELETNWLRIAIVAAGGISNGNQASDLWIQLNAASGFRVSKYTDENKLLYYLSAP